MTTTFQDVPLFHLEQARITPEHIRAIWLATCIPDHPQQDTHQAEALRLANTDPAAAVEFIVDQHPASIPASSMWLPDRTEFLRDMRDHITGWLANPDTLPTLLNVPTLEDCHRLAQDVEHSEAARCLAWLLGTWPGGRHVPGPTMMGDPSDEPGAVWVYLMPGEVSLHRRTEEWPHAVKEIVRFQHPVSDGQLVGTARWLLAQAGAQA